MKKALSDNEILFLAMVQYVENTGCCDSESLTYFALGFVGTQQLSIYAGDLERMVVQILC